MFMSVLRVLVAALGGNDLCVSKSLEESQCVYSRLNLSVTGEGFLCIPDLSVCGKSVYVSLAEVDSY